MTAKILIRYPRLRAADHDVAALGKAELRKQSPHHGIGRMRIDAQMAGSAGDRPAEAERADPFFGMIRSNTVDDAVGRFAQPAAAGEAAVIGLWLRAEIKKENADDIAAGNSNARGGAAI